MERDSVPTLFHDLVTCNLEGIADLGFEIYGKYVDIEAPKALDSNKS